MNDPYPWRCQLLATAPTLALLAVLYAVFRSESAMANFFAEFRPAHPFLTSVVRVLTDYGNPVFYACYAWLLLRGIRHRAKREDYRFALAYAIAIALTLSTVYLMKSTIGRARPYLKPEFRRFSWTDDFHSFPSGHTTEAVISAVPLAMRARRWRIALLFGLAAAMIAFTRAYLSMHYMTDILGGVAMGNIGAWLTWLLYSGLHGKKPGNPDAIIEGDDDGSV